MASAAAAVTAQKPHHDARRRKQAGQAPGTVVLLASGHQDLSHLDNPRMRPASGRRGRLERAPRQGKKFKGEVHAWGEVIVKNGDVEFRARNKITGQGLRHLINANLAITGGSSQLYSGLFATNDLAGSYIRVGTGTGSTLDTTVALAAPVATNPGSTSLTTDNPVAGQYRLKFIATWNAGALTAVTVTEIGMFGRMLTTLGSGYNTASTQCATTALTLFARLSSTDGEFTAFTINTAVPLTIEYRVIFTFT